MPKRKRSQYESKQSQAHDENGVDEQLDGDGESLRAIAIHKKSVEQKIYHHGVVLKRALKTGKGFEQQKLGKRIKAARKGKVVPAGKNKERDSKEEVERLEKELDALKDVDLQQLASTYLNKALLKNRQLSSSKYFPESVAKDVDQQSKVPALAGPVANVCARLLNSNPVREAMKEIVASLANILKIETANANDPEDQLEDKARPSKETKLNPARETVVSSTYDESEEDDGDSNDNSEDEADDNGVSLFDQDEKGIETSMLKKLASNYLAKGGDVSSDEEEDESDLDDRIVLSSGAEDISDSEGGDDVERPRGRSMSITPIPEDELRAMKQLEEEDFEIDEDDSSDEDMDSDPRVLEKQPKKTKRPKPGPSNPIESHPPPTESIRTSSFLPSLMSGYISGSESEASSLDDGLITSKKQQKEKKNKGPAQKKVRKNRMGQQARRALAEKKFGTGANHIKKEKEAKEAKQKQKEEKRRAWEQKQSQPAHVSWQLKKKEKEEKDRIVKTMMSGNGVGMGKKIVFD